VSLDTAVRVFLVTAETLGHQVIQESQAIAAAQEHRDIPGQESQVTAATQEFQDIRATLACQATADQASQATLDRVSRDTAVRVFQDILESRGIRAPEFLATQEFRVTVETQESQVTAEVQVILAPEFPATQEFQVTAEVRVILVPEFPATQEFQVTAETPGHQVTQESQDIQESLATLESQVTAETLGHQVIQEFRVIRVRERPVTAVLEFQVTAEIQERPVILVQEFPVTVVQEFLVIQAYQATRVSLVIAVSPVIQERQVDQVTQALELPVIQDLVSRDTAVFQVIQDRVSLAIQDRLDIQASQVTPVNQDIQVLEFLATAVLGFQVIPVIQDRHTEDIKKLILFLWLT
jgi:hypothetical protein